MLKRHFSSLPTAQPFVSTALSMSRSDWQRLPKVLPDCFASHDEGESDRLLAKCTEEHKRTRKTPRLDQQDWDVGRI